jgi:GT2 family glycosyltransferase
VVNISIIIPTYHRKDSCIRLLRSIQKQHAKDIEVVVVEQGDNNGKVLNALARLIHIPFQYIFQKEISTSKAKNRGVSVSLGKFLIFYDDDVILQENAIGNIIKNFSDRRVGGVCGRVIDPGRRTEKSRVHVGKISILSSFSDGFSSDIRQEIDTVIGCNAAWKKDVFEKVGGFDEQFSGNAMREESDLSLRIKKIGYKIIFDPTAPVVHLREPHGGARKADDRLSWYFHYFSNETYFFLKHRTNILLPLFLLTRSSSILRCMFGFGREVSIQSLLVPIRGIRDGIRKYDTYRSCRTCLPAEALAKEGSGIIKIPARPPATLDA